MKQYRVKAVKRNGRVEYGIVKKNRFFCWTWWGFVFESNLSDEAWFTPDKSIAQRNCEIFNTGRVPVSMR